VGSGFGVRGFKIKGFESGVQGAGCRVLVDGLRGKGAGGRFRAVWGCRFKGFGFTIVGSVSADVSANAAASATRVRIGRTPRAHAAERPRMSREREAVRWTLVSCGCAVLGRGAKIIRVFSLAL
jgi:hypothetical protein